MDRTPQSPGCALVLIGDGELRGELETFAKKHHLEKVRFIGPVDYDSIGRWYAVADSLVMPTLEDNWSLVVPEAMAAGLPIVCSKYNGCWPELVQAGRNGWVFDPLDTRETAGTLMTAYGAKNLFHRMGAESKTIVADFSPHNAAEAIYQACRIAIG